jgi:hypothetical protein
MAPFSMKIPRAKNYFFPRIHKCHAIPSEEITLSFIKRPNEMEQARARLGSY